MQLKTELGDRNLQYSFHPRVLSQPRKVFRGKCRLGWSCRQFFENWCAPRLVCTEPYHFLAPSVESGPREDRDLLDSPLLAERGTATSVASYVAVVVGPSRFSGRRGSSLLQFLCVGLIPFLLPRLQHFHLLVHVLQQAGVLGDVSCLHRGRHLRCTLLGRRRHCKRRL